MPNFVFPLLCVSSADVNFWVNGGWDQPECPITIYILSPLEIVFALLNQIRYVTFKVFILLLLCLKF